MNKWVWMAFLIALSGCASKPAIKSHDDVLSDVAAVVQGDSRDASQLDILATRINSHGQLADHLMIAAGGGWERLNVRDMFAKVSEQANGKFLMFGANPTLDKAIVAGALSDQQFPRVWLFFVGEPQQEQEMKGIVEAAGIKYSFISKYK